MRSQYDEADEHNVQKQTKSIFSVEAAFHPFFPSILSSCDLLCLENSYRAKRPLKGDGTFANPVLK